MAKPTKRQFTGFREDASTSARPARHHRAENADIGRLGPQPPGAGDDASAGLKGLWVDADIINAPRLTWTERVIFAYMRFRAERGGEFWEFNKHTAEALKMSVSTVKRGLDTLRSLGLVEGRKGDGFKMRVRMPPDWYAEKGLTDAANMTCTAQNEPTPAGQIEPGGGSERTPAQVNLNPGVVQNEPCILIEQGIGTKSETDEDESSSSSVFENGEACGSQGQTARAQGDDLAGQSPAPPDPALLPRLRDVARLWTRQVAALTQPRTVVAHNRDRNGQRVEEKVRLVQSQPGGCSDADIAALLAIAKDEWPDHDPEQAFRLLLRACAAGQGRVDKLQNYGARYVKNNSVSLAGPVRIAGDWKNDPGRYARECAGAAFQFPAPTACAADPALAAKIRDYSVGGRDSIWGEDVWWDDWLEASARCSEMRVDPSFYAACVRHLARTARQKFGGHYPVPWIASMLTPDAASELRQAYVEDRMHAWSCGGVWNVDSNRHESSPNYEPCNGVRFARAVAAGETGFKTRSCLLCAASELTFMPELAAFVPEWKGTAAELASRLSEVAAETPEDQIPERTESCGREGHWFCSMIRCGFRLKRATYTPEFEWEREERRAAKEEEPAKQAEVRELPGNFVDMPGEVGPCQGTDTVPAPPVPCVAAAGGGFDPKAFLAKLREGHTQREAVVKSTSAMETGSSAAGVT